MIKKHLARFAVACVAVAATATAIAPVADAATKDGWIGPTPIINGNSYLHYSTISNTPLFANTRIYTSFGYAVPAYTMGVRSRLFKSGALCVINPVKYNATATGSLTDPTSGDCGPGWYNSHGFVLVDDGTNYQEFVTFPTDPLKWGESGAAPAVDTKIKRNENGQTYGSAAEITDDSQLPDLVSAIGTNGRSGYIKSADIPKTPKTKAQARALPERTEPSGQRVRATAPKRVPVYESNGTTIIDQFQVR